MAALEQFQRRIDTFIHSTATSPEDDATSEFEGSSPEEESPWVAGEHVPEKVTLSNIFRHPHANTLVLDLVLLRKYGPGWLGWETATTLLRVKEDFRSDISLENFHKIQAAKTLHLVDSPWKRWEDFLWCAQGVNGYIVDFSSLEPIPIPSLLVAVEVFNRIREDVPWSDEVKGFISTDYRHEGLFVPVAPADFVSILREADLADFEQVAKDWPQVRDSNKAPTAQTPEGQQLRMMLEAFQHLEEFRRSLRVQFPLLHHV